MAINLSNISQYFQYPSKVAELKDRLYNILKNKGIEVTAAESLNSLIEKVREVEPALEPQTIYLTQNNTSYDVTEYTEAIVDVPPVTVENDLDGLIDGSLKSFTMPSTISSLANERFLNFKDLSTVIAPRLKEIPDSTFEKCISLEELNLPEVNLIGNSAFKDCVKLSSINVNNAYYIGENAFENNINLQNIDLTNLRELQSGTFKNCYNLSSISAPNVRLIDGSRLFVNTNLSELNFPNVYSLRSLTLSSNRNLKYISFPNLLYVWELNLPSGMNNTELNFSKLSYLTHTSLVDSTTMRPFINSWSNLTSINMSLLLTLSAIWQAWFVKSCPNLTEIKFPLLTRIYSDGLACDLPNLKTIDLGYLSSMPTFFASSYYFIHNCENLESINCKYLSNIASYFMSSNKISSLDLPNTQYIYTSAFNNLSLLSKINASVVSYIGNTAFLNCYNLSDYNFEHLTFIGNSAFKNCSSMSKAVKMETNEVHSNAFNGCYNLKEIYFNTVSTGYYIDKDAFSNCGILTDPNGKIYVPSSKYSNYINTYSSYLFVSKITSMSEQYESETAFAYEFTNSGLTSFPESKINVKAINQYAFSGCKLKGSITLSNLEYIGNKAFYNMWSANNSLTLNLPSCKTISTYAFYNNTASVSYILPEVEYIGHYAFQHNPNSACFVSISMPNVKYIGDYAFQSIRYLTISSPELSNLEYIGSYAFASIYYKFSVEGGTLSLPKLEVVNDYAFYEIGYRYGASWRFNLYAPKLKNIQYGAFQNCYTLSSVTLSDIEIIGGYAFNSCAALRTIDSLYNCKVISNNAFYNDYNLSFSISSPNLLSVGQSAFFGTKLNYFSAPELLFLAADAFNGCASLSTVYAPKINKLYTNVFQGCTSLSSLTLDFSAISEIQQGALSGCWLLSELNLPNVTSISNYAFKNCYSLSNLIINSNYSYIKQGTFAGCSNLDFTNINLENMTSIESEAFSGCSKLYSIKNNYIYRVESSVFLNCTGISEINLPNVVELDNNAFYDCTNLSNLNIKYSNIYKIPQGAFLNCYNLSSLYFERLESIESSCFQNCSGLTEFNLVNVTIVPNNAFDGCQKLSSINLGNVTSIGESAFHNCYSLNNINLNNIEYIGSYAFDRCSTLSISIPNLSVVRSATYRGTDIKEIINDSVNAIHETAFYSCSNLSEISLPNLYSISMSAFQYCNNLTSIYIPNIRSIGAAAFASTGIYSIPEGIDNNLSQIPQSCFQSCNNLYELKLNSILSIGSAAFYSCNSLSEIELINIKDTSALGSSAFLYCNNLERISLPNITNLRSYYWYGGNYSFSENTAYYIFGGANNNIKEIYAPKCSQFAHYIFYGNLPKIESIYLPECTYINGSPFSGKAYLKNVDLGKMSYLWDYAFYNCSVLNTINISNIFSVGNYTFQSCGSLISMNLPRVSSIGINAFFNCINLSEIKATYLNSLGQSALAGCSNLKNIDALTIDNIAYLALLNCSNLESIKACYIDQSAIWNCTHLSNIYLLTASSNAINIANQLSTTPIGNSTYLGYYGSIYVPSSRVSVYQANYASYSERFTSLPSEMENNYIHAYQYALKTISLSEIKTEASYILRYAFNNASFADFSELNLSNVKYIGSYAFRSCYSLTSINLPECERIEYRAFENCTNLEYISLPKVYSIGDAAFYNCNKLKVLSLPEITYGGSIFTNLYSLEELYVSKIREISVINLSKLTILDAAEAYWWWGPQSASIRYLNLPKLSYLKIGNYNQSNANLWGTQLSTTIEYLNIGASYISQHSSILASRSYGSVIMSNILDIPSYMFNSATISYAEFNKVTSLGVAAFRGASIGQLSLPELLNVSANGFEGATILGTLDLPKARYLGAYALSNLKCSDISMPQVSMVSNYALYRVSASTLKFNAVMSMGTHTNYQFAGASVKYFVFNNNIQTFYQGYNFADNSVLEKVVFKGSILTWGNWYGSNTVFPNTPIANSTYLGYYGSVYVPRSYLDSYRTGVFSYYSNRVTAIEDHESELRELGLID